MNTSDLQTKSNDDLVSLYEAAATEHRLATDRGDPKTGNRAHDLLAAAYRELRRRGNNAQCLLLPLLDSPKLGVRGWAAAHALEFAPNKGIPVLEALSKEAPGWDSARR